MIVSWNWLTQYVRLDMPVEVLTERLALAGLNHESTAEVGGDLAIDLEVTSNRPDCLGHLGVAREIAVLFDKAAARPRPAARPTSGRAGRDAHLRSRSRTPDLCPRFTARVVSGVRVGESPWWLRKRLETLGVRPISNVVDVTNYVMFECGQPLHAYDLDRLAGRRLVVRRARPGETLTAINGKTYELSPEMLAIADAERPVGLARRDGGLDTEIGPGSTNVLIEAAQFDPISIRKTARALGLHSPSSYRFERPIDPEGTEWASRRCAELILETAGGTLHPGVIDVGAPRPERPAITLRLDQIPRVLGIAIDRATVARILRALGLEPLGDGAPEALDVPPAELAERPGARDRPDRGGRAGPRLRAHPRGPRRPPGQRPAAPRERVEAAVRDALTGCGFDEAVTFSLVADELRRADRARAGRRRRSASSIRAGGARTRCGRAWCRACWPPAATTRRTATPTPTCSRSPTSTCPAPTAPCPTSRPGWAWSPGATSSASRGSSRPCSAGSTCEADLEVEAGDASRRSPPAAAAELLLGGTHLGYLGEVDRAPARCARPARGVLGGRAGRSTSSRRAPTSSPSTAPCRRSRPWRATCRWSSPSTLPWADLAAAVAEAAGPDAGGGRLPRHLPGRERPRGPAEPPLRPPVPPPRADPDRRRGRARRPRDRRRLRRPVRRHAAGLSGGLDDR